MRASSTSALLVPASVLAAAMVGCTDYGVAPIEPPAAPTVRLLPELPTTVDRLDAEIDGDPGAEGIRLTYAWFRDGQLVPELITDAAPASLTRKGELWQVVVTPWSGSLEGAPGRAEVEIVNSPPVVEAVADVASPTTRDDLSLTIVTADADLDEVTTTVSWTRDGEPTPHTGPLVPATDTTRGEVWEATITPDDGESEGTPALVALTIANSPPTADVVVLGPEPARTSTTLSAEVRGADDLDGDPITWTFAWFVDGSLVAEGPEATLDPSFTAKHQRVWVDATPSDGLDDGETLSSNEILVENTPPRADAAIISPDPVFTTTDARCDGLGFADDDGDPEGFEFRWTKNGADVGSGAVLASASFVKGDRLSCIATPTDGEALGTPVTSPTITVANSPPSISGATLAPSSPKVADTITVAVGGTSDADGDPVTYRYAWTVDGATIGHTGASLTSAWFRRGQAVAVTVTPFDGTDEGAPVTSAAVTVANTAPVVTGLTLAPRPAYTTTSLTATPTATDADSDGLSYVYGWYVNGAKHSTTGATLASSAFAKGDAVYADVVATDGTDSSTAVASSTVTISNSVPSTPGAPALTPTSPIDTDDLVCTLGTTSTDADGDPITYEAEFRKGSTSVTTAVSGTTAKLGAGSTAAGDVWTCRVRALDDDGGISSWSTDSASVTVRSAWTGLRTFTNCGQTGTTGPSSTQCSTAYTATTLAGEVTVTEGMQEWTVPITGTYRIWACGGAGASATAGRQGGRGACVRGDFSLTKDDTLMIVVGQRGTQDGGSAGNGGGGGGTWVVRSLGFTRWSRSNSLLLVGGGGGGTRASVSQNGCDGRTTLDAGTGSGSSSTHGCGALSSTYRGQGGPTPSSSWGSSGGGWTSDGAGDGSWGTGGRGFANKLLGSAASSCGSSTGGFGGGATGNGCWGGGGGGGYSGGQGGMLAGGGGSYNGGSTTSTATNSFDAHGYVTIDLL